MTPKIPISARLFVLLAQSAPVGVILRRGPGEWTQLIKWRTDSDTFEAGQWIKGNIFNYCTDLSPDGKLFLYVVQKWANKLYNPDVGDLWLAISKPPYFTALGLIPNCKGGYFIDPATILLYDHGSGYPQNSIGNLNVAYGAPNLRLFPYGDAFFESHGWTLILTNGAVL